MELEAFKESEKSRIRKSVRGVMQENGKLDKLEPEDVNGGCGEDGLMERALQQLIGQANHMRQVSRNGDFQKRDHTVGSNNGNGNGMGRGTPWAGRQNNREGPGDRVVPADRNYVNGPVYDMSRVKCFRCDQMGHFVRNCPELVVKSETKEKKVEDLNAK
jgi:hypothetical protein